MLMLLRVCAILISSAKFTKSAKFVSRFEESQCVPVADLKNGVVNKGNIHKNDVSFKCDDGLISNVPNLPEIWFTCKFIRELGRVAWKGQAIGVVTEKGRSSLYLHDVKCVPGCPPPDYSEFPENMAVKSTKTAKLKMVNMFDVTIEDNTYFMSGDNMAMECKDGYVHKGNTEQVSVNDSDDNYSYTSYGTSEVAEDALTTSLKCGENGKWNNGDVLNYGICKAITCDARAYQNIRNGVITHYKDVYEFTEMMTLECDLGFRPSNNRYYMQCLHEDSFENQDFKCEAITCPTPPEPLHGRLETTHFYYLPNETAEFYCDYGYTMVGSQVWECQFSGTWDKACVQCVREDDYCQPPCVPFGARVIDAPRRTDIGTTIEFACNDKMYGGSTNRTCLFNKQWSDGPIDCTGWSLFTSDTGIYLKEALNNAISRANGSLKNDNEDENSASGLSIRVNSEFGVDAYILLDVSRSIDEADFEKMKMFVIALVKNLGVSNDQDGTRVAVYLFATNMSALFNQRDHLNETTMIEKINSTTLRGGKGIGQGTAISAALEDVRVDIETKRHTQGARNSQQVVILISDGKYTQRGSPIDIAEELKTKFEVEFFSIAIGTKEDTSAFLLMEAMASKIAGEKHFFAVDKDWDITDTINKMIENSPDFSCGATNPIRTDTKNISQSRYGLSSEHAWPWMAQFRNDREPACGGTLISNRWVLTAAHCFVQSSCNLPIRRVVLKQLGISVPVPGTPEFSVQYGCPAKAGIKDGDVIIHEKYNNSRKDNYTYDIALVKLPYNVSMSTNLHTVCLWTNETNETTDVSYESLFKPQTYGVVTGWGYKDVNNEREAKMKQMQFPIQNFTTCTLNKAKQVPIHFDERLMFCAGTSLDERPIIDACLGDSGGPFVVPHPRIENKYIQIGIVSFQTADGCRDKALDGYYTRLNEELLDWIQTTMNTY